MNDREIDVLVAEKVMGWTWITEDDEQPEVVPYLRSPATPEGWHDVYYPVVERNRPLSIPRYSTDIAAAWQVITEMRGRGYEISITTATLGTPFLVTFSMRFADDVETWDAVEDRVERAGCLAALKAVGVEVSDD